MPEFDSFFMGGFECATQRRNDGRRLDLQAATQHDRLAEADFRALQRIGILTYRDGLRWHAIERIPGVYNWDNCETLLHAARKTNSDVIWDLCHYGWPDWLDVWSEEFPLKFSAFAAAAARHLRDCGLRPIFCLINEISFLAWAGGENAEFFPSDKYRGVEMKTQLSKAAIQAARAIRNDVPDAVFVSAEPLINIITHSESHEIREAAASHCASQHEALDMLLGRQKPELGGDETLVDVVGLNFYPQNQWYHDGSAIPLGHHDYRPLRLMLQEAYVRYRKPILIAETGAEGSSRSSWLHYICGEVSAAMAAGVSILGICIYPVLEYPGWDNDRICAVGLLSAAPETGERLLDEEFAAELSAQQSKLTYSQPARNSDDNLRHQQRRIHR